MLLGEGRGIYHGDVMWCRRGFQIKFAAVICADRRRVGKYYLLDYRFNGNDDYGYEYT